jgi:molybdenum cofactor cytidylyltransferase
MAAAPPVGILLAAGRGRRFDPSGTRKKLLQLLPGSQDTVLSASASTLTAALPRVLAVVRPGDDDVAAVLRAAGCEVIVCVDADSGMAASLAAALRAVPDGASIIVALGDMPWVAPSTVQAAAHALAQGALIAAPVYQGRRGNPVGLSGSLLPELLALRGDQGARGLIERHGFMAVPVDDAGIVRDVDEAGDLTP